MDKTRKGEIVFFAVFHVCFVSIALTSWLWSEQLIEEVRDEAHKCSIVLGAMCLVPSLSKALMDVRFI